MTLGNDFFLPPRNNMKATYVPTFILLLIAHFAIRGAFTTRRRRLLLLWRRILQVMRRLRLVLKRHGLGGWHARCGRAHGQRSLGIVGEIGRVQTATLLDGTKLAISGWLAGHGGHIVTFTGIEQLVVLVGFAQKDRVTIGCKDHIAKDVVEIECGWIATLRTATRRMRIRRRVSVRTTRGKERRWSVGMRHGGLRACLLPIVVSILSLSMLTTMGGRRN
jgi:hypothetical protein